MTTRDCRQRNPLSRQGSSQLSRELAARAGDYYQVDDRSTADFILFARKYSENLRFHGASSSGDNANWQPFFEADESVAMARLARLPLAQALALTREIVDRLDAATLTAAERSNYFLLYLQLPLMLLSETLDCYRGLRQDHRLRREIDIWMSGQLALELSALTGFYKGAVDEVAGFSDQPLNPARLNLDDAVDGSAKPWVSERLASLLLSERWDHSITAIIAAIDPSLALNINNSLSNEDAYIGANARQKLSYACRYNLLTQLVERAIAAFEFIVEAAKTSLQDALQHDGHEPHYGLWLTFLTLFSHSQTKLNQFGQRHLDFYYRDVLQIQPRAAVADQLALVFELRKNAEPQLLDKGRLFDAGKDSNGNPVRYSLNEDTAINQAKLVAKKSFFYDRQADTPTSYGATQADSGDGVDAELQDPAMGWPAFYRPPLHGATASEALAEVLYQPAFIISDPQLALVDGERHIDLNIRLRQASSANLTNKVALSLSTEEGWTTLDETQYAIERDGREFSVSISLSGAFAPLVAAAEALHGFNGDPALRIALNADAAMLHGLVSKKIARMTLSVNVSNSRDFSLSNDLGTLDASKPFLPFGPFPQKNSHMIIGGRALFAKPLAHLSFNPVWRSSLNNSNYFLKSHSDSNTGVDLQLLTAGQWQPYEDESNGSNEQSGRGSAKGSAGNSSRRQGSSDSRALSRQSDLLYRAGHKKAKRAAPTIDLHIFSQQQQQEQEQVTNISSSSEGSTQNRYTRQASSGFIRWQLNRDFGHDDYPNSHTLALLKKAGGSGIDLNTTSYNYSDGLPKKPYTPELVDLSVNYQSVAQNPARYFHQYPFGLVEVSDQALPHRYLLPQLRQQGELYLGFEDIDGGESLSLLFSVVEGSANPLKSLANLEWHYLVDDHWQPFKDSMIRDDSDALSRTGIVRLAIPLEANSEHQLLASGLLWIRLSVAEDADALSRILSINPQAGMASFIDQGNSPDWLAAPLAAATISKALISNAHIKSIEQPLTSSGGQLQEQGREYYRRVSEQLRHKSRASTIWDYEHLVLEHFSEVYQLKCLNHTALCSNTEQDGRVIEDGWTENGLKPGHVLLVPIPRVSADSQLDPRRPYCSSNTLQAIEHYIRARCNPFVCLKVSNPKIEEIQLKFTVYFHSDYNDLSLYSEMLNRALADFLMPWSQPSESQQLNRQLQFEGLWHKSTLINFIEEQYYVDYLLDVEMHHRSNIASASDSWQSVDHQTIQGSSALSILVSHRQHQITPMLSLQEASYVSPCHTE